jgi:hypothetical protein
VVSFLFSFFLSFTKKYDRKYYIICFFYIFIMFSSANYKTKLMFHSSKNDIIFLIRTLVQIVVPMFKWPLLWLFDIPKNWECRKKTLLSYFDGLFLGWKNYRIQDGAKLIIYNINAKKEKISPILDIFVEEENITYICFIFEFSVHFNYYLSFCMFVYHAYHIISVFAYFFEFIEKELFYSHVWRMTYMTYEHWNDDNVHKHTTVYNWLIKYAMFCRLPYPGSALLLTKKSNLNCQDLWS